MDKFIRRFKSTPYYSSPGEYIPRPRNSLPSGATSSNMLTLSTTCADNNCPFPPANGKCIITTLPIELIQEISKHLFVESLVCFSLTSKTILYAIGSQSWTNPSITGRWSIDHARNIIHRVSLLCFLARDVENLTYCSGCVVLHPRMPRPRDLRVRGGRARECFGVKGIIDYFPKDAAGGYTLTFEHVKEALGPVLGTYSQEKIEMMSGHYTLHKNRIFAPTIKHTLDCSARRIGKQLVLKRLHRFSLSSKAGRLWPQDILSFPLRICPHHTTSTEICRDKNTYAYYWNHNKQSYEYRTYYNTPMLTHAITSAFPAHKRITTSYLNCLWFLRPKFREPAISEDNQMKSERGKDDVWWCRSCPTKFRVEYEREGQEVVVTVWQCLGRNEETARTNWRALVRRERNTEFTSESRDFPLFRCD